MSEQSHRWARGLMTSTSIFGLTLTGLLAVAANYFVTEFSRPHMTFPDAAFDWHLSQVPAEPPESLQHALLFRATDGVLLRGDFWAQPYPAPTVVLCHGYRTSRAHMRAATALEYSSGYNVLSFDFRGHGGSDSVMTSAGNAEVRDLEAAIFAARRQPETLPGKIIIHGFSMGASVALLLPPQSDVQAIIADSPYANSDDIMRRLIVFRLSEEWQSRLPCIPVQRALLTCIAWLIVLMCTIVFRLRFGFNVVARPSASFKRWKTTTRQDFTPILLIHAAGDTLIPIQHAYRIETAARIQGAPLETYFVDAPDHCGAYVWNPEQYNRVIQQFLAQHA